MLQQEGDSFWLCCVLMWTLKAPQVHAEFSFSSSSWMFELWSDVCAELHTKTLFFHIYCSKCTFSPSWLKRACRHDLCSPASLWTCQTQQPAQKPEAKFVLFSSSVSSCSAAGSARMDEEERCSQELVQMSYHCTFSLKTSSCYWVNSDSSLIYVT